MTGLEKFKRAIIFSPEASTAEILEKRLSTYLDYHTKSLKIDALIQKFGDINESYQVNDSYRTSCQVGKGGEILVVSDLALLPPMGGTNRNLMRMLFDTLKDSCAEQRIPYYEYSSKNPYSATQLERFLRESSDGVKARLASDSWFVPGHH
jgi:hypothetical protein